MTKKKAAVMTTKWKILNIENNEFAGIIDISLTAPNSLFSAFSILCPFGIFLRHFHSLHRKVINLLTTVSNLLQPCWCIQSHFRWWSFRSIADNRELRSDYLNSSAYRNLCRKKKILKFDKTVKFCVVWKRVNSTRLFLIMLSHTGWCCLGNIRRIPPKRKKNYVCLFSWTFLTL